MGGLNLRTHGGKEKHFLNLSLLLQGLFLAFIMMFVFSIALTVVTIITDWVETDLILNLFNYLSIVVGAVYVGSKCKRKVWLHGMGIGVLYLLLLTWLAGDIQLLLSWVWVKQFAVTSFFGILGGFIGALLH